MDTFHKDDRVTWTKNGKQLTGTIRWEPFPDDVTLCVRCEQTLVAGGVPIGRIERPRIDSVQELLIE